MKMPGQGLGHNAAAGIAQTDKEDFGFGFHCLPVVPKQELRQKFSVPKRSLGTKKYTI
jgi:hypothetical protein